MYFFSCFLVVVLFAVAAAVIYRRTLRTEALGEIREGRRPSGGSFRNFVEIGDDIASSLHPSLLRVIIVDMKIMTFTT